MVLWLLLKNRIEIILERHHRRSIRLKGFDYSHPGYYFVTICTKDRECLLAEISDSKIYLNEIGKMSDRIWHEIPEHFPNAAVDQFIVMPNHLHGIIQILEKNQNKDTAKERGLMNQAPTLQRSSDCDFNSVQWIMMKNQALGLGKIIRFFKARSALEIRNKKSISFYWQRNYFEHIVRDKSELFRIRNYIRENPVNWSMDEDNPLNVIKER
jgi:REP element-mobilizing transposase RayT